MCPGDDNAPVPGPLAKIKLDAIANLKEIDETLIHRSSVPS